MKGNFMATKAMQRDKATQERLDDVFNLQSNALKQRLLYGHYTSGELPFSSLNEIQIHENELATATTFNISFQHLLDNDLYLENVYYEKQVSDLGSEYFAITDVDDVEELSSKDTATLLRANADLVLGVAPSDASLFTMSPKKKTWELPSYGNTVDTAYDFATMYDKRRLLKLDANTIYVQRPINASKREFQKLVELVNLTGVHSTVSLPEFNTDTYIVDLVENYFKGRLLVSEDDHSMRRTLNEAHYFLALTYQNDPGHAKSGLYAYIPSQDPSLVKITFTNTEGLWDYKFVGFYSIAEEPTLIIVAKEGSGKTRIFYASISQYPLLFDGNTIRELLGVQLDGVNGESIDEIQRLVSYEDDTLVLFKTGGFLQFSGFKYGFPSSVQCFATSETKENLGALAYRANAKADMPFVGLKRFSVDKATFTNMDWVEHQLNVSNNGWYWSFDNAGKLIAKRPGQATANTDLTWDFSEAGLSQLNTGHILSVSEKLALILVNNQKSLFGFVRKQEEYRFEDPSKGENWGWGIVSDNNGTNKVALRSVFSQYACSFSNLCGGLLDTWFGITASNAETKVAASTTYTSFRSALDNLQVADVPLLLSYLATDGAKSTWTFGDKVFQYSDYANIWQFRQSLKEGDDNPIKNRINGLNPGTSCYTLTTEKGPVATEMTSQFVSKVDDTIGRSLFSDLLQIDTSHRPTVTVDEVDFDPLLTATDVATATRQEANALFDNITTTFDAQRTSIITRDPPSQGGEGWAQVIAKSLINTSLFREYEQYARDIFKFKSGMIDEFSTTKTYDVGQYVIYNGGFYECKVAVTEAGAWNAADWRAAPTEPDKAKDAKGNILDSSGDIRTRYANLAACQASVPMTIGAQFMVPHETQPTINIVDRNFGSVVFSGAWISDTTATVSCNCATHMTVGGPAINFLATLRLTDIEFSDNGTLVRAKLSGATCDYSEAADSSTETPSIENLYKYKISFHSSLGWPAMETEEFETLDSLANSNGFAQLAEKIASKMAAQGQSATDFDRNNATSVLKKIVPYDFDEEETYAVDQFVTYNNTVYKCIRAIDYPDEWTTFNTEKTYTKGQYVIHGTKVYECKEDITTAGAWDATKWIQCWTEASEKDLASLTSNVLADFKTWWQTGDSGDDYSGGDDDIPEFSTASTYQVGDYCQYLGTVYRCIQAITTPGEWNDADWTDIDAIPEAYEFVGDPIDIDFTQPLTLSMKSVVEVTPEFSIEQTYGIGDHCMHDGKRWVCVDDVDTAGAWDESQWEEDPAEKQVDARVILVMLAANLKNILTCDEGRFSHALSALTEHSVRTALLRQTDITAPTYWNYQSLDWPKLTLSSTSLGGLGVLYKKGDPDEPDHPYLSMELKDVAYTLHQAASATASDAYTMTGNFVVTLIDNPTIYGKHLIDDKVGWRLASTGDVVAKGTDPTKWVKPSLTTTTITIPFTTTFSGQISDRMDETIPAFSDQSTYNIEDLCKYNNAVYKCVVAVTSAGAWDATKWTRDYVYKISTDPTVTFGTPTITGPDLGMNVPWITERRDDAEFNDILKSRVKKVCGFDVPDEGLKLNLIDWLFPKSTETRIAPGVDTLTTVGGYTGVKEVTAAGKFKRAFQRSESNELLYHYINATAEDITQHYIEHDTSPGTDVRFLLHSVDATGKVSITIVTGSQNYQKFTSEVAGLAAQYKFANPYPPPDESSGTLTFKTERDAINSVLDQIKSFAHNTVLTDELFVNSSGRFKDGNRPDAHAPEVKTIWTNVYSGLKSHLNKAMNAALRLSTKTNNELVFKTADPLLDALKKSSLSPTGYDLHNGVMSKALAKVNAVHTKNFVQFDFVRDQIPMRLYCINGNSTEPEFFGVVGRKVMFFGESTLTAEVVQKRISDTIAPFTPEPSAVKILPFDLDSWTLANTSASDIVYWMNAEANNAYGLRPGVKYPYLDSHGFKGFFDFVDFPNQQFNITNLVYSPVLSHVFVTISGSNDIYAFNASNLKLEQDLVYQLNRSVNCTVFKTRYSGTTAKSITGLFLSDRNEDSFSSQDFNGNCNLVVQFSDNSIHRFTFTSKIEGDVYASVGLSNVFSDVNLTAAYRQFSNAVVNDIQQTDDGLVLFRGNTFYRFVDGYAQVDDAVLYSSFLKAITTADPVYTSYYLDNHLVLNCLNTSDSMSELYPYTQIDLCALIPKLKELIERGSLLVYDIDMTAWSTTSTLSYIVIYTNKGVYLIDMGLTPGHLKYDDKQAIIDYFTLRARDGLGAHLTSKHHDRTILSRFNNWRRRIAENTVYDFATLTTNTQYTSPTEHHGGYNDNPYISVTVDKQVFGQSSLVCEADKNPGVVFAAVSSPLTKYDNTWQKMQIASPLVETQFYDYFYRREMAPNGAQLLTHILNLNHLPFIYRQNTDHTWDMWIDIPSTMTVYMNRIVGSTLNVKGGRTKVEGNVAKIRKNLNNAGTTADPNEQATTVRLYINTEHFHMDTIREATISGASLPLYIYRDYDANDGLFDGVQLQSVWNRQIETVTDKHGIQYTMLEFKVWGADEQCVHLRGETAKQQ